MEADEIGQMTEKGEKNTKGFGANCCAIEKKGLFPGKRGRIKEVPRALYRDKIMTVVDDT